MIKLLEIGPNGDLVAGEDFGSRMLKALLPGGPQASLSGESTSDVFHFRIPDWDRWIITGGGLVRGGLHRIIVVAAH